MGRANERPMREGKTTYEDVGEKERMESVWKRLRGRERKEREGEGGERR